MNWLTREDRDALKRIVALLFFLAALADRVAHRTTRGPVSGYALGVLLQAEAVAQAFVIGMADRGMPSPYLTTALPCDGDEPTEAMLLAQRLRLLAVAVSYLLACAQGLDGRRSDQSPATLRSRPEFNAHVFPRALQRLAHSLRLWPDTS